MRSHTKTYLFTFSVFIIILLSITIGFCLYNQGLEDDLANATCETLIEVTEQQRFNLHNEIVADIKAIKNLAKTIIYSPTNKVGAVAMMGELVKNTNFGHLIVVGTDGKGISSRGTVVDVANKPYFAKAMAGETFIHPPISSLDKTELTLPIATPIEVNGKIMGVLVGSYAIEKVRELILPSFGGLGFAFVTDGEGEIIVAPENNAPSREAFHKTTNLLENWKAMEFVKNDTLELLHQKIKSGQKGHSTLEMNGEQWLMQYAPLGINDWYIFALVSEDVIAKDASHISRRSLALTAGVSVLFGMCMFYIWVLKQKTEKEQKLYTQELERIAFYDDLTGIQNLNQFKKEAASICNAKSDIALILVKFDILNFKMINEMFGFSVGDQVLCAVAEEMAEMKRKNGLVSLLARVNADEFVLLEELGESREAMNYRPMQFEEAFHKRITNLLGNHRIEFRYGRYFLSMGETDLDTAYERVNMAHGMAKKLKTSNISDYNDTLKRQALRDVELENRMEIALGDEEFCVYLQPKYALIDETIVGAEALVRWQPRNGPMIFPNEFIPLFERNGFVVRLDFYMFEQACRILRNALEQGRPVVPISINFSRLHLLEVDFAGHLEQIATRYGVPRKYLEIELTESTMMDNEDVLIDLLERLHVLGFKLSMDDFGTGYSSLGLLKNLPLDVIKIDKSFFDNNRYEERAKTVIEHVIKMASELSIATVAEGVEHQKHITLLRTVGCDVVQGYFYAKPMPWQELFENLAKDENTASKETNNV